MSVAAVKAEEIVEMVEMLPEQEQDLAYELIKRLVLAWDPDFTKLTAMEAAELDEAIKEHEEAMSRGEKSLTRGL